MNKLVELISNGTLRVEELKNAPNIIETADFVSKALDACYHTLVFTLGVNTFNCYDYMDRAGEYHAWGEVSKNGTFTVWSNWGGNHTVGSVNLTNPNEVFMALVSDDDDGMSHNLRRFLDEQIRRYADQA